jgi:amidohydrolase
MLQFQEEFSLSAVDSFDAWIRGDGGHGAYPHTGSDPLSMLASILPALYAIQSRQINPLRASVVSLGQIHAGSAPNVIPAEVYLSGTIRSFEQEVREQLWAEIERALSISEKLGGSYEFKLIKGYPSLYNDPTVNGWMKQTAIDVVGDDHVQDFEFGMGAEDFAYMAQKAPGAMFSLGAAIPDGVRRNHHTPIFDIDESVLPMGAAVLAETARRYVTGQLKSAARPRHGNHPPFHRHYLHCAPGSGVAPSAPEARDMAAGGRAHRPGRIAGRGGTARGNGRNRLAGEAAPSRQTY